MANILDSLKTQLAKARQEYRDRKREIEKKIRRLEGDLARLDAEYAAIGAIDGRSRRGPGRPRGGRASTKLGYGGVRTAVLDAIRASKGLKPREIIAKTGLSSGQVHNALTGLKKSKDIRAKAGLYTAG